MIHCKEIVYSPFRKWSYYPHSKRFKHFLQNKGGQSDSKEMKNLPAVQELQDMGSIPESGRSPGGGHGNPLQYSSLESPMNRGAQRVEVHGVAKVKYDWSDLAWTNGRVSSKLGQNVKFGRIEKFLFLTIFFHLVDGPYAQGKLLPSVYIPTGFWSTGKEENNYPAESHFPLGKAKHWQSLRKMKSFLWVLSSLYVNLLKNHFLL